MFFIRNKSSHDEDFFHIHITPTVIIFFILSALTLWATLFTWQNIRESQERILDVRTNETISSVQADFRTYENMLRAARGLFEANNQVTRQEWRVFIESFDLENRYPGVLALAFSRHLEPQEIPRLENEIRNEGFSDFRIYPEGIRDKYSAIVYIEPFDDKNKRAFGFDMYTETNRREAMELAEATNAIALSGMVRLVQEPSDTNRPGFLLYMPIFQNTENTELNTKLLGFVYAPFVAEEFLSRVNGADEKAYGFRIHDGVPNSDNVLFESKSYESLSVEKETKTYTVSFPIENRQWYISAKASRDIVSESERARLASVFWTGTLLTLFSTGFLYVLLLHRTNVLKQREDKEIQMAKDDLLALASHQLRTPATGVKQYISLLRDGYAGELSATQRSYLEKAYMSNERQIATINEMLVVAKADAGKIDLLYRHADIIQTLRDSVAEHTEQIKDRQQRIRVDVPKGEIRMDYDELYTRMVFDNVISNASKYTNPRGQILIKLQNKSKFVRIIISDTGVGIREEDMPHLFVKFSRIPNSLTKKVTGSGIGLYLSRKIVEAQQGTMTLTSKPGQGTTVTIDLQKRKSVDSLSKKNYTTKPK